jgi:murein L,D-transpeptidase YcbB/YkuD
MGTSFGWEGGERLYDELLHKAVRSFQTEHGFTPDGNVGASTQRAGILVFQRRSFRHAWQLRRRSYP